MKSRNKMVFIYTCIIPTLLLFLVFTIYPMVRALTMAFYSWSGVSQNSVFIGFDNFKTLLGDPVVWSSLKNNLFFMFVVPLFTMLLALFFAVTLTRFKFKEKNFYRVVFFFPNVLSVVVIAILWMFIYNPTFGVLNSFLEKIGLGMMAQVWLGDSKFVLWAIAITMIWSSVGYYMVLYIAGIENIPEQIYEASRIDGAGEFLQFVKITFPLIWEVVRITIVFFILNVFNGSLAYINIMTAGGPDRSSEVLTSYMYGQAFKNANYGYASAIGMFIFLIVLVLALISNRLTEKDSVEY